MPGRPFRRPTQREEEGGGEGGGGSAINGEYYGFGGATLPAGDGGGPRVCRI